MTRTSASSSNGSANLMSSTLTQGARLLTAMLPLNTVAYDPSPQSTNSLIVILEIGGELVDQITEAFDD